MKNEPATVVYAQEFCNWISNDPELSAKFERIYLPTDESAVLNELRAGVSKNKEALPADTSGPKSSTQPAGSSFTSPPTESARDPWVASARTNIVQLADAATALRARSLAGDICYSAKSAPSVEPIVDVITGPSGFSHGNAVDQAALAANPAAVTALFLEHVTLPGVGPGVRYLVRSQYDGYTGRRGFVAVSSSLQASVRALAARALGETEVLRAAVIWHMERQHRCATSEGSPTACLVQRGTVEIEVRPRRSPYVDAQDVAVADPKLWKVSGKGYFTRRVTGAQRVRLHFRSPGLYSITIPLSAKFGGASQRQTITVPLEVRPMPILIEDRGVVRVTRDGKRLSVCSHADPVELRVTPRRSGPFSAENTFKGELTTRLEGYRVLSSTMAADFASSISKRLSELAFEVPSEELKSAWGDALGDELSFERTLEIFRRTSYVGLLDLLIASFSDVSSDEVARLTFAYMSRPEAYWCMSLAEAAARRIPVQHRALTYRKPQSLWIAKCAEIMASQLGHACASASAPTKLRLRVVSESDGIVPLLVAGLDAGPYMDAAPAEISLEINPLLRDFLGALDATDRLEVVAVDAGGEESSPTPIQLRATGSPNFYIDGSAGVESSSGTRLLGTATLRVPIVYEAFVPQLELDFSERSGAFQVNGALELGLSPWCISTGFKFLCRSFRLFPFVGLAIQEKSATPAIGAALLTPLTTVGPSGIHLVSSYRWDIKLPGADDGHAHRGSIGLGLFL